MNLEVQVSRYLAWVPRLRSEVSEGDRVMQSDIHPDVVRRQEIMDEPSVTYIHVPEVSIGRMHDDHVAAMQSSGGAILSQRRILARHLQGVMAEHAPSEAIKSVSLVADEFRTEDERASLERFLNAQLVEDEA